MNIQKATAEDAVRLTQLTIRSKSYWDYTPEQIEKWRDELTITTDYINQNHVFILVDGDDLIGYYSFILVDQILVKLDNFFIDPEFIGMGFGKKLMLCLFAQVKERGMTKITLDSEPNATAFYQKLGFTTIGKLPSSIENRYLPIMMIDLKTKHQ